MQSEQVKEQILLADKLRTQFENLKHKNAMEEIEAMKKAGIKVLNRE